MNSNLIPPDADTNLCEIHFICECLCLFLLNFPSAHLCTLYVSGGCHDDCKLLYVYVVVILGSVSFSFVSSTFHVLTAGRIHFMLNNVNLVVFVIVQKDHVVCFFPHLFYFGPLIPNSSADNRSDTLRISCKLKTNGNWSELKYIFKLQMPLNCFERQNVQHTASIIKCNGSTSIGQTNSETEEPESLEMLVQIVIRHALHIYTNCTNPIAACSSPS